MQLTTKQYDALERAILRGTRIVVRHRRGTEYVLIPTRLESVGRRESLHAVHPTTGDAITLDVDEIESLEVVW